MFELTGEAGQRLDHFLAAQLPRYSRARLQDWIKRGLVEVDGAARKPSFALRGGERIHVHPGQLTPLKAAAEEIPLDILYEDEAIIAVNKPAGMTVHSGAGVHQGTLVNALLHRFQQLSTVSGDERPGIVHRLDRYTSGVLLVARTDQAHRHLQDQFAARTTDKIYLALVQGVIAQDAGRVERPISRSLIHRFKMAATESTGRYAVTDYRVLRRYSQHSYLEIKIGTGRTHQIRVHLASLKHPVAGDTIYGGQKHGSGRFFLHASRIGFAHPVTGERLTIAAPLPPELERWLQDSNL
jgi:23S rRNA pseudouridine1911/1915/1917 synthase